MAGKRQHIIPKFLIDGFVSRKKGDEIYVWACRKGGKPFEPNTKNIMVEQHFYGDENNEASADEVITLLEGGYSSLIQNLRINPTNVKVIEVSDSYAVISEFIAHLVLRTKHFRESLRSSTQVLLDSLDEYFLDFNNIRKLLLANPFFLRKQFENHLAGQPIPQLQKNLLLHIALSKASDFIDENKEALRILFSYAFPIIKEQLSISMRSGHINALAKYTVPNTRSEIYKNLRWFICHSDEKLILGDIGCLFQVSDTNQIKKFRTFDEKVENIFLPISSDIMLIGSSAQPKEIDFKLINQEMVKHSLELFACSRLSSYETDLIPFIGKESNIFSESELQNLMHGIISQIEDGSALN